MSETTALEAVLGGGSKRPAGPLSGLALLDEALSSHKLLSDQRSTRRPSRIPSTTYKATPKGPVPDRAAKREAKRAARQKPLGEMGLAYDFQVSAASPPPLLLPLLPSLSSSPIPLASPTQEITKLSAILLDVRKSLLTSAHMEVSSPGAQETSSPHHRPASKATLLRAERVNATFRLYYLNLEQAQYCPQNEGDPSLVHGPNLKGVVGVYNPLQTMRNRAVRARYGEWARDLSVRTITPALELFSSRKLRLVWQVDINEALADYGWRSKHWGDLRNPKGELWFPRPGGATKKEEASGPEPRSDRLASGQSESLFLSPDYVPTKTPSRQPAFDDSSPFQPLDTPTHRHGRATRLRSTSRSRADKAFHRLSSALRSSRSHSLGADLDSEPGLVLELGSGSEASAEPVGSLLLRVPIISLDHSVEPVAESRHESHTSFHSEADPEGVRTVGSRHSEVTAGGLGESARDLTLGELVLLVAEPAPLHAEPTPSAVETAHSKEVEQANDFIAKLKYLAVQNSVSQKSMDNKPYVRHREMVKHTPEIIANLNDFGAAADRMETTVIPEYTRLMATNDAAITGYHSDFSHYSNQIDALLSTADRSIVEINTSLALQLRKITERTEKIDPYRASAGVVGADMRSRVLENAVVVVLWMVWGLVSILRVVRAVWLVVWAVFRYMT